MDKVYIKSGPFVMQPTEPLNFGPGEPADWQSCRADSCEYHFQKWVVEEVDGFVTTRRIADDGIDGRLYFALPNEHSFQSMVIEVKGGANVGIGVVRDLRGVLERDIAAMAGLIVMNEPGTVKTRNFHKEMASAGDLDVLGVKYSRMQILTVSDILAAKRFHTP